MHISFNQNSSVRLFEWKLKTITTCSTFRIKNYLNNFFYICTCDTRYSSLKNLKNFLKRGTENANFIRKIKNIMFFK